MCIRDRTLAVMGVPVDEIPEHIASGCKYDREILKFGQSVIAEERYISCLLYTSRCV